MDSPNEILKPLEASKSLYGLTLHNGVYIPYTQQFRFNPLEKRALATLNAAEVLCFGLTEAEFSASESKWIASATQALIYLSKPPHNARPPRLPIPSPASPAPVSPPPVPTPPTPALPPFQLPADPLASFLHGGVSYSVRSDGRLWKRTQGQVITDVPVTPEEFRLLHFGKRAAASTLPPCFHSADESGLPPLKVILYWRNILMTLTTGEAAIMFCRNESADPLLPSSWLGVVPLQEVTSASVDIDDMSKAVAAALSLGFTPTGGNLHLHPGGMLSYSGTDSSGWVKAPGLYVICPRSSSQCAIYASNRHGVWPVGAPRDFNPSKPRFSASQRPLLIGEDGSTSLGDIRKLLIPPRPKTTFTPHTPSVPYTGYVHRDPRMNWDWDEWDYDTPTRATPFSPSSSDSNSHSPSTDSTFDYNHYGPSDPEPLPESEPVTKLTDIYSDASRDPTNFTIVELSYYGDSRDPVYRLVTHDEIAELDSLAEFSDTWNSVEADDLDLSTYQE